MMLDERKRQGLKFLRGIFALSFQENGELLYIASSKSVIKNVQLGFSLVQLEIDDKKGTTKMDVCVE